MPSEVATRANPINRVCLVLWLILSLPASAGSSVPSEVRLPSGTYLPFFPRDPKKAGAVTGKNVRVSVPSFRMDTFAVTNREFLRFVEKEPSWRRSQVPRVFADVSYLSHWKSDLKLASSADAFRPVTHVSWFAASAYCRWKGKELPTTDQWEYAAEDGGRNAELLKEAILKWYSKPNGEGLPRRGQGLENGYGLRDLFGVVWEWTSDFNSVILGGDDAFFCGAASLGAVDAADYAKFMRYSFRASLSADYTTANLGFRCARKIGSEESNVEGN